ncbi:MAG TPA: glucose-6-phosphate dehydrogenase assembly protein OpcA, partial [Thermodesulfobacteriota bacterium]
MSGGTTLAGVERELRRLWSEAAASAREQGEPLLRASVVNLVVVTDGPNAVAEVTRALAELAESVPGRMIVVVPEPFAPEGFDAWPSIQCRPLGRRGPQAGAHQVCGEQVVVHARGAVVGELPALVRPLLETDVPSVLWWRAPLPAERSVLDRLAGEVQTVVVDTARGAVWADGVTPGGDPIAAVAGLLARRGAGRGGRWTVRDLAFARLTPWRELTAALFD